jgi:hypothetical protein
MQVRGFPFHEHAKLGQAGKWSDRAAVIHSQSWVITS